MKWAYVSLICALGAPLLTAQVPYRYLAVGERALSAGTPGISFLNPANGVVTPVVGPDSGNTMKDILTLAVDPSDPTTLYAAGATSGFLGGEVWPVVLQGNRHPIVNKFRPAGMPGFAFPYRYQVYQGDLLMTVQGGSNNGMYLIDLSAKSTQKLAVTVPNFAGDIALIGDKAYVNSDNTTSDILEWDLVTSTARPVGTGYPQIHALVGYGGRLLAGLDNGDILDIDPATGLSTVFASTGLGPINVLAIDPGDGSVFLATVVSGSQEIYALSNLTTPIYATGNTIRDMAFGVIDRASLLFYGDGCQGSNGLVPRFDFVNLPTIGSRVTFQMSNGTAGAPTFLLMGFSRTQIAGLPLPIDLTGIGMTGCFLLMSSEFDLAAVTNASGVAAIDSPIPNNGALKGASLSMQWVSIDGPANPLGVVSSGGAQALIR